MPSLKESSTRQRKVSTNVKRIVTSVLLKNGMNKVVVTDIELSPDMRYATVFFRTIDRSDMTEKLEKICGYLRTMIFKELSMKYSPTVRFRWDKSLDKADEIEHLLRINKPQKEKSEEIVGDST